MGEVEAAYTDAHVAAYPVEYIAGIDLYNAGEFHAAHDVWEERWMGEVGWKEKRPRSYFVALAWISRCCDVKRAVPISSRCN